MQYLMHLTVGGDCQPYISIIESQAQLRVNQYQTQQKNDLVIALNNHAQVFPFVVTKT